MMLQPVKSGRNLPRPADAHSKPRGTTATPSCVIKSMSIDVNGNNAEVEITIDLRSSQIFHVTPSSPVCLTFKDALRALLFGYLDTSEMRQNADFLPISSGDYVIFLV